MLWLLNKLKAWMAKRNGNKKEMNTVEKLKAYMEYEKYVAAFKKAEANKIKRRQGMKGSGRKFEIVSLTHYGANGELPETYLYDQDFSAADYMNVEQKMQKKRMAAKILKFISDQVMEAAIAANEEDSVICDHCECDGIDRSRTIQERLNDIMEMLADIGGQLLDKDGQVPADIVGVGAQLANVGIGLAAGPGYKPPKDVVAAQGLPWDGQVSRKEEEKDGGQGQEDDEDKDEVEEDAGCFAKLFGCCLNFSKPYDMRAFDGQLYY